MIAVRSNGVLGEVVDRARREKCCFDVTRPHNFARTYVRHINKDNVSRYAKVKR